MKRVFAFAFFAASAHCLVAVLSFLSAHSNESPSSWHVDFNGSSTVCRTTKADDAKVFAV